MPHPLDKILYVEDETQIQFITKFALERLGGFSVAAFGSGGDALVAAVEFKPDLALLDVRMPDLNGPDTLVALRQLPGLEDLPAVFMTADVTPADLEGYRRLGALDAISKPYEPEELPERLRAIWAARGNT